MSTSLEIYCLLCAIATRQRLFWIIEWRYYFPYENKQWHESHMLQHTLAMPSRRRYLRIALVHIVYAYAQTPSTLCMRDKKNIAKNICKWMKWWANERCQSFVPSLGKIRLSASAATAIECNSTQYHNANWAINASHLNELLIWCQLWQCRKRIPLPLQMEMIDCGRTQKTS